MQPPRLSVDLSILQMVGAIGCKVVGEGKSALNVANVSWRSLRIGN